MKIDNTVFCESNFLRFVGYSDTAGSEFKYRSPVVRTGYPTTWYQQVDGRYDREDRKAKKKKGFRRLSCEMDTEESCEKSMVRWTLKSTPDQDHLLGCSCLRSK